MKKNSRLAAAAAVGLAVLLSVGNTWAAESADELVMQAKMTVADFERKDPEMKPVMEHAAGYAVFPNVNKAGLAIGAANGQGVLFEHGRPVGRVTITQVSIGAQAGAQSFSELVLLQTPSAVKSIKTENLKFAASLSAIAASAGVARDLQYRNGVAVITIPKGGLMAEAAVGGQSFKYEPFAGQPRT